MEDYNIDILKNDSASQEHLSNLLEEGFVPGFQTITRPSVNNINEGHVVTIFLLKLALLTRYLLNF